MADSGERALWRLLSLLPCLFVSAWTPSGATVLTLRVTSSRMAAGDDAKDTVLR